MGKRREEKEGDRLLGKDKLKNGEGDWGEVWEVLVWDGFGWRSEFKRFKWGMTRMWRGTRNRRRKLGEVVLLYNCNL